MNTYQERIFGVKLFESFVAVEETTLFEDITKYDFLLKDMMTSDYNGNYSYRVDVMGEIGKEAIINGWKLESISLPGNWYGQNSYFCVTDKLGDSYRPKNPIMKELWYDKQPVNIIRETLLAAMKFCQTHYSVKYSHVTEGFIVPTDCNDIESIRRFSLQIEQYIKDYHDMLHFLEENGLNDYIDNLNKCFCNQINKCYRFDCKITAKE